MSYGSLDLKELQYRVGTWSQRNFGDQDPSHVLLGVIEELGELAHAQLKGIQGIRHTSEEIREMKEDAVADIIIYLCDYCHKSDINIEQALINTWRKVSQRDWANDPQGAADKEV